MLYFGCVTENVRYNGPQNVFQNKIFQTANQIQIRFEPPSRKLSLKHAQFYMMQSLKSLLVHYTDSANDLGSFSSIQTLMSNAHPHEPHFASH